MKLIGGKIMSTLVDFRDRQAEIQQMISDLRVMLQPEYLSVKPNAKTAHDTLFKFQARLTSRKDIQLFQDTTC